MLNGHPQSKYALPFPELPESHPPPKTTSKWALFYSILIFAGCLDR
jgi:hypothetical protein